MARSEHARVTVGRFAPSTTGPAHPGTLLAALLCWLDARSLGGRVGLRLEDLDPERSSAARVRQMREDLLWFGLDWDFDVEQSSFRRVHEQALDQLAEQGLLYPCSCSRAQIRALGSAVEAKGFAYPGTCRGRTLPPAGWRTTTEPLRARLEAAIGEVFDESGFHFEAAETGDPIVRRRDGAIAYQLATVVDDAAAGVTRIVRGRDLAPSTALQVALQRALGLPTPRYRHHLLLLEERGEKFAKLHGAVGASELRAHYSSAQLCGVLACLVGLQPNTDPTTPRELLASFDWARVASADRVVRWTGSALEWKRDGGASR